jgi:hypothetical protein
MSTISFIVTPGAMLILNSVVTVGFVLPASILDMLDFSKSQSAAISQRWA